MFDKKEYVNTYIKEKYKTIKIRIKNDDKVLLKKINSVNNINQYLINLVKQDIQKNKTYNFIDNNIKIDFDPSLTMKDLISRAEEADFLDDYGLYLNLADAIDSQAKKEASHHMISEREWNLLLRRYCV